MEQQSEAEIRLEIYNLLSAYGHLADVHDGDGYGDLFTEDAVIDMSALGDFAHKLRAGGASFIDTDSRICGRASISDAVRLDLNSVGAPTLQHFMTNMWIKTISSREVTTSSYFMVFGDRDGRAEHYGKYHDVIVRCDDGRWRIKHHKVERGYERTY